MKTETIQKCIDLLNTDGINSKEQVKRILQEELRLKQLKGNQYEVMGLDEAQIKASFTEDYKHFNEYLQQCIDAMARGKVKKPYTITIHINLFRELLRYDYDITSLKDYGIEYIIVNNDCISTKYKIISKNKLKVIEEVKEI